MIPLCFFLFHLFFSSSRLDSARQRKRERGGGVGGGREGESFVSLAVEKNGLEVRPRVNSEEKERRDRDS